MPTLFRSTNKHYYQVVNTEYFPVQWTWNSFRLISLVFIIIWFVSAYFFKRPIKLQLIYKQISAISNIFPKKKPKTKEIKHTLIHTYIQIDTRDPIALFSKLSYELNITIQNSLVVDNGWNKIFKGFILPVFSFWF